MPYTNALFYPKDRLRDDFIKAGGGLLVAVLLIAFVPGSPVAYGLAAISAGAGAWLGREALRRRYVLMRVDEKGVHAVMRAPGIVMALFRRETFIAWDDLKQLKLRWYATRRDRSQGFFELTLRSEGPRPARLVVDDRLNDFLRLLREAEKAARRNLLMLDEATAHNLAGASPAPAGPEAV